MDKSNDRTDLRTSLLEFDGRATTYLTEAAARFQDGPSYLDDLIGLMRDPAEQLGVAATWLIKHHLEAGAVLSADQTGEFVRSTDQLSDWQSILHVCQSVRFLNVAASDAIGLAAWIERFLNHKKPFVRAWSVDALCALSADHPALAGQAREALDKAKNDPAASVKARARNIKV